MLQSQDARKIFKNRNKKKNATRGLNKRSPILVLHSPKHASLRSSYGIRCFSAGMIASDILELILPLIPVPRRAEATRGPRALASCKCFTALPRAAQSCWFRILEWQDAQKIFTIIYESKRPKSKKKECNTRTSPILTSTC